MAAKKPAAKKVGSVSTPNTEPAAPSKKRPSLVRNINIDGKWYGPAWGNADAYPDEGHDGRPELFGA